MNRIKFYNVFKKKHLIGGYRYFYIFPVVAITWEPKTNGAIYYAGWLGWLIAYNKGITVLKAGDET